MTELVCEVCKSHIAKIDMEKLKLPLEAEMFTSVDPRHDIPAPFEPDCPWDRWRCFYCQFRPMQDPDVISIYDKAGYHSINIAKLDADRKLREDNQQKINEMWGEERIERPSPISRFYDAMMTKIRKEPENVCVCGRSYKHPSSLIRHQKDCEAWQNQQKK